MDIHTRLELLGARASEMAARGADAAAGLLTLDVPVPDVALLAGAGLALMGVLMSQRGRQHDMQARLEEVYQAELLTANRRTYQANGELRRARLEIERERQKRRREVQSAKKAQAESRRTERPVPVEASVPRAVVHV